MELSRWWFNGKSLKSRDLFFLWFQVQTMWLLISWSLEVYMIVNFRAREISRGTRKLARTPTLNLKKKKSIPWNLTFFISNTVLLFKLHWLFFKIFLFFKFKNTEQHKKKNKDLQREGEEVGGVWSALNNNCIAGIKLIKYCVLIS